MLTELEQLTRIAGAKKPCTSTMCGAKVGLAVGKTLYGGTEVACELCEGTGYVPLIPDLRFGPCKGSGGLYTEHLFCGCAGRGWTPKQGAEAYWALFKWFGENAVGTMECKGVPDWTDNGVLMPSAESWLLQISTRCVQRLVDRGEARWGKENTHA